MAAFCGIGSPDSFRRSLERCGYNVVALREFADHFDYATNDVTALAEWASSLDVAGAICTCKDLVKVGPSWPGTVPLLALKSELKIVSGLSGLELALARCLPSRSLP